MLLHSCMLVAASLFWPKERSATAAGNALEPDETLLDALVASR